jgi:hypothetical protein
MEMGKVQTLAIALLLSIANQLLRDLDDWAGVRNAASDLQTAIWEVRNAA